MEKKSKTKNKMLDILKILFIIFTISVLAVNVTQAKPPECRKGCTPQITSYNPLNLTIYDNPPANETFSITVNQTVNVTWFFDGTVHKTDNSVSTSSDAITTSSTGVHNVTAVAQNANGSVNQTWTWNVYPPPQIVYSEPQNPIINDNPPATETFSITADQTVNVTWFFDGAVHKTDNSVNASSDAITASSTGMHNVTAVAQNANGRVSKTWTWNVYPPPQITSYNPQNLTIYDNPPANETFSITVNQTVDITWSFDGAVHKTDNSVSASSDTIDTNLTGVHNVTAVAQNANGSVSQTWAWSVYPPPQIVYYRPLDPIIYDTEPANRTFGITADQDAYMSFTWNDLYYPPVWWPAGEEFFLNDLCHCQSAGTYNITFTASNNNGTASKSWVWIVSPPSPPQITSYNPPNLTIYDNPPANETFSITVNQTVSVIWSFDGAVHKTDNSVNASSDTIDTNLTGAHNVTAVAQNANGMSVSQTWTWNVYPPPQIVYYKPEETLLNDTDGAPSRNFSITLDQDTYGTWCIQYPAPYDPLCWEPPMFVPAGHPWSTMTLNGKYGTNIVTVNASNNNGTVSKEWIWNVNYDPLLHPPPNITQYIPQTPFNVTAPNNVTFGVATDVAVDVTWCRNGICEPKRTEGSYCMNYVLCEQTYTFETPGTEIITASVSTIEQIPVYTNQTWIVNVS